MRARNLAAGALALIGVSAFTVSAKAQEGFGINRFDPSERGSEWFSMDSLDLRGTGRLAIGIPTEWSYRSLVNYDQSGEIRESIVRNMIVTHPGLSVVLFDRLRLGASLPVQLFADGHRAFVGGQVYNPPSSDQAIGDLRLAADVRIVGKHREPFTLAVGAQVHFPTGDKLAYAGDDDFRVHPRLQIAGEVSAFVYAARLGYQYRARQELFGNAAIGQEFTFGASAGLRVADKKLVIGPELWGSTVLSNPSGVAANADSPAFTKRATPLEILLGAHYTVAKDFRLGAGIGTGLSRGYGSPVVRGLFNFEWAPGYEEKVEPTDRDKDGIEDAVDACPDQPGVRSDDPTKNGCPLEDKDGDGIVDKDDACVDLPGIKTEDPKTNGCPADKDGDGVYDQVDACVDTPGEKSDDPKKNGCPGDRDGDGVIDKDDKCPDQPGKAELQGCPDPVRDKEGIENDKDACPDEPGKADPDPKKSGCPKAFIKEGKIKILDQVKFKTNSAEILKAPDSDSILEAVAKILKDHPEIKKIRVEGHTDTKGIPKNNLTLSKNRAASVVKWLTKAGVDKARMESDGYGQDKPIDSNTTEEGRKNNRRVEFNILDGNTAPAETPKP